MPKYLQARCHHPDHGWSRAWFENRAKALEWLREQQHPTKVLDTYEAPPLPWKKAQVLKALNGEPGRLLYSEDVFETSNEPRTITLYLQGE